MSPRVGTVTTRPVAAVKNATGSTTVPIWPMIRPEYACRPFLITSDPTVRFDLTPASSDGPPDTLRLRLLVPDSPFAKVTTSYWLSLNHDRCVVKSARLRPSFDDFGLRPTEITALFSHFQESPAGITFPARRTTTTSGTANTRITDFVVNFEVADDR